MTHPQPLLDPAVLAPAPFDALAEADRLARTLELSAAARDRTGGHARTERELIRASGLLNLTIPARFGGLERPWAEFYRPLRRLAQADSALAHVYAFHHLQVVTILLYGRPDQHADLLASTVAQNLFWGNALNPNDRRTQAIEDGEHFRIQGPKSYCSGSVGADRLTFSAWHEPTQSLLIGVVPAFRTGVSVLEDWDAFGQRQTDSGTVAFDRVTVYAHEVLVRPGTAPSTRATLRPQLAQLILTNLYVGIAQGALQQGLHHTRERSRPFFASGVDRAVDDPYVQQRYGQLRVLLRPAEVLADLAAERIDQALALGDAITPAERGEVALAVAEAKVVAHKAALEIASQVFELTGPGATATHLGLDRFWRNARVHTLHDPVDYKLRDLGRHALTGRHPEPTSYS